MVDEELQTVFAKAEYDPAKPCVEAVLDSSRYFVVRVEDNGRRAYIGMGFLERTDSFDFSGCTDGVFDPRHAHSHTRRHLAGLYEVSSRCVIARRLAISP